MDGAINRRWIVGWCETGVYLTYHDRQLLGHEIEFDGNIHDHLNDKGIDKAIHGKVKFTDADQSYPALAAYLSGLRGVAPHLS